MEELCVVPVVPEMVPVICFDCTKPASWNREQGRWQCPNGCLFDWIEDGVKYVGSL